MPIADALRIQVAVARRRAVGRPRAEGPQQAGDELRRVPQPAVVRIGLAVAARLGVEQDGPDHRLAGRRARRPLPLKTAATRAT